MPPVFEKDLLLLEGKRKLSSSGKQGVNIAVAILFVGSAVFHLIVAMFQICTRYKSVGMRHASKDKILVLVE